MPTKESPPSSSAVGNFGLGLAGVGTLVAISGIWAGGGVGTFGFLLFLVGLLVFGLSPEGRAATAKKAEQATPELFTQARKLLGVTIRDHQLSAAGQEPVPVKGLHATVEDAGTVTQRVTATRVLAGAVLAGPVGALIGAGVKKQVDQRALYVVFTTPDGAQVLASANVDNEPAVRLWTARFNTWTTRN